MNQACPERSRRDPESILSCPSGTSWLIAPFGNKNMQNKPNLQVAQINVTSLLLTTNDQRLATREAQNKPKQTQFLQFPRFRRKPRFDKKLQQFSPQVRLHQVSNNSPIFLTDYPTAALSDSPLLQGDFETIGHKAAVAVLAPVNCCAEAGRAVLRHLDSMDKVGLFHLSWDNTELFGLLLYVGHCHTFSLFRLHR